MTDDPWDGDPLADTEPTPIPVAPGQQPAFEATLETVDDPRTDTILQTVESILRGVIVINTKVEELKVLVSRLPVNAPPAPPPAQPAGPVDWQLNQPPPAPGFAPAAPPPAAAPVDPTSVPGYGWVCPVHGQWKVVPPGVTRQGPRQGQPYPAFIACPAQGCREKPPRS